MNIKEHYQKHSEISEKIKERWKQLVSPGYFLNWEVNEDFVIVQWELPRRLGGGIGKPDKIPIECFETEDLDKAKKILKDSYGKK